MDDATLVNQYGLNEIPLMNTKFIPPSTSNATLLRPRLIEKLNDCASGGLTLICAPAGFGKSTLLQHWAQQAPLHPAWLSIEASDNEMFRFWRYVIYAVDQVRPGFSHKAVDALKLIQPTDYRLAMKLLHNELQGLSEPLWLILDDFHYLTDNRLLASLRFLFEHLPSNVHLIIASRTEMPFPFARWITHQLLTRLYAEDLRFSPQEGYTFYSDCMLLELSELEADEWVQRTEGWITAMKLSALTLRDTPHPPSLTKRLFPESPRHLEQFLLEEVFDRLDADVQQFLLDCSLLSRLNASLCQAVSGNAASQLMLERLEREQLFLFQLDNHGGWFRFHHLFALFLQRRLIRYTPQRLPALYAAAGRWCMQEGLNDEALDYYLKGKHYDQAVQLLQSMSAKTFQSDYSWLNLQFSLIPVPVLIEYPAPYFSYINSLMVGTLDFAKAEHLILTAERAMEQRAGKWAEEKRNSFLGMLFYVKMMYEMVVNQNMEQSVRYLKQSQQFGKLGSHFVFAQPGQARSPSLLKEHRRIGIGRDKHSFLIIFQNLIAMFEDTEHVSMLIASMAEWHYEHNELNEAERTAERALKIADLGQMTGIRNVVLLPARIVLARIQRARGLWKEAEAILRDTRRELVELGGAKTLMYCDGELAVFAFEQGNPLPAAEWMATYRLQDDDNFTPAQWYEYYYLAKLLTLSGGGYRALAISKRLLYTARQEELFYCQLEAEWLTILLLHQLGETEEACLQLERVLRGLESYGVSRSLIDWGNRITEVIMMLPQFLEQKRQDESPSIDYLRAVLGAFEGTASDKKHEKGRLDLLITRKEREVLQLLAARLTNRQIADRLGIGLGTVRTHLNNIYSKLYVSSRKEAIHKAEMMGIQEST